MDSTWTMTELVERAAQAGPFPVNGRVRDTPNERLIRWYTTIGLVDPPLGRRGRVALYGERHLLQLIAIKRRQSAGRTIAEIQVELAGATDADLSEIAQLPLTAEPGTPAQVDAAPRARFWADRPSVADPPIDVSYSPAAVRGVRLAPGVTLVLDGDRLDHGDIAAIETASRPLVDELRRRGLIPASDEHSPIESPGRST